jgi:hypothetical protein
LRFITGHSLLIASRIEARTLDFGVVFEDEHDLIPGFLRQKLDGSIIRFALTAG